MKVFTVQTLENFMSLQNGLPEMDFFRGQSSSEYKLTKVSQVKIHKRDLT